MSHGEKQTNDQAKAKKEGGKEGKKRNSKVGDGNNMAKVEKGASKERNNLSSVHSLSSWVFL